MTANEKNYFDWRNELVSAVNDYGSDAASTYMAGWGKQIETEWVGHTQEHGVEATVKAIDEYCEPDGSEDD